MKYKILEKFSDKKIVINVKTQEEYDELMEFLAEQEFIWISGELATMAHVFEHYGKNTCIRITSNVLLYDEKASYLYKKFKIISYQDFMDEIEGDNKNEG